MITFCLLILSMLCMESVHSCGLSDLVRILQECSRRLFSNWNSSYCNVASGQCKDNKRTSNLMSSLSIPISLSWFVYPCGRFLWIIFVYHTPCRQAAPWSHVMHWKSFVISGLEKFPCNIWQSFDTVIDNSNFVLILAADKHVIVYWD